MMYEELSKNMLNDISKDDTMYSDKEVSLCQ